MQQLGDLLAHRGAISWWRTCWVWWKHFFGTNPKEMGFVMLPHPLTSFDIKKHYQQELKLNWAHSCDNLHSIPKHKALGIKVYGTKVFSFYIQKFSRCIKRSCKMSLELEVFTSLSMIINSTWLLKLWHCYWKCLQASIAFGFLISFLWLFNLTLNTVSTFPKYCLLHSVHSIK